MSRYPETLVGNFENKSPRKSEANLVSESICDDRETEIILKYIHKKFSKYQTEYLNETISLNICFSDRSSLAGFGAKQEQQRSTVIVNPSQFSTTSSFVKVNTDKGHSQEEDEENKEGELVLPEMQNIDIKDLKDIQTICMSFLAEEPPFMQEKQQLFYNAWYEVNIILILMANNGLMNLVICNTITYIRYEW